MLVSLNSGSPSTAAGNPSPILETPAKAAVEAPVAVPRAAEPAKRNVSRAELEKAVQTLNKFTEMAAQDVRFSIDEQSGKTVVKVVDVETQTVLRQIPNAEALALSHSLDRMQGLLVRDQA